MDDLPVGRLKMLLLVSSLVCVVYLLLAAFEENVTAEWRGEQLRYARFLAETSQDAKNRKVDYTLDVRQNYLPDLERLDRCITCHVGIDDPECKSQSQPLTSHPGTILEHHPSDKFGCTVCHQGQGRATDKDAAHGQVAYWDKPLLSGDFVQSTCATCHQGDEVAQAPVLTRGRHLLRELGCVGCHKAGEIAKEEKAGPRLSWTGSKVSRKWLIQWLTDPEQYLPKAKMPNFGLSPGEVNALAAYLMTFRNAEIDNLKEVEGDSEAGAALYRESQCIVCHVTKLDYADNPVGGEIGPSLLRIGNKVTPPWLVTFLRDPHAFLPNAKMPGYHFSDQEARNLSQYVIEEWTDYDLADAEEAEPDPPPATPDQIEMGKKLFAALDCTGCHDLTPQDAWPAAPDLTYIGSTPTHLLAFGDAKVPHTLPDFFYTKLKSPRSLFHRFQVPAGEQPVPALWENLHPTVLFSGSRPLPERSTDQQLAWILEQVQQVGMVDAKLALPDGPIVEQSQWLLKVLNDAGALNQLRMPDFHLSDEDAEALTIALMSLSEASAPSKRYEVPSPRKVVFNPKDEFGELQRHYRCLSCHKIRDSGDLLASDLTYEGNRVKREWLYHYLNEPYSMRRMLTIAMPIFHFPEQDSRLMADYVSHVFVDSQMGALWKREHDKADPQRGKELFDAKGCIACHQRFDEGGDVGPSLTTQVPEFPQGTWVGDKLKGQWIFQWLKDPQSLLPETIEPNLGLSDQEALDLTSYLLTLRNPEYAKKAPPTEAHTPQVDQQETQPQEEK
ncbi:MAG: cytochrome c family protein [Pirellulaceae bacterium]